jgi:hypothetical protein
MSFLITTDEKKTALERSGPGLSSRSLDINKKKIKIRE